MSDLDRLFYWRGIAEEYQNYRGEPVRVPLENRLNLLSAMGVDVTNPTAVADEADELDIGPWRHLIPPLQTCRLQRNEPAQFFISLHPERLHKEVQWFLEDDAGTVVDYGALIPQNAPEVGDYVFNGVRYSRRMVVTSTTKPNYYHLRLKVAANLNETEVELEKVKSIRTVKGILAAAPLTVHQPDWLEAGANPWGFIIQLYTIRSGSDWGIGDFSDLKLLIRKAAALGADIIGLNPLHVLLPDVASHNSPYSPSDRRFVNPLYIDPEEEPDYIRAADLHADEAKLQRLTQVNLLREKPLVDYTSVKNLKYPVFESMFKQFIADEHTTKSDRWVALQAFIDESGVALQQFALYEVARNRWQGVQYSGSIADEILTASPESDLFQQALNQFSDAVLFHCYLQWLAHEQLATCQSVAIEAGMEVGLVRDLAVGADGGGAEAFSNPKQFCQGVSVGAPPDPLAEQGQNWGLPPMDPAHLRATGYTHFIQILRENMSRCGALRIDHAMALMRLWWCPPGKTADHGAYVYYPFGDMLALLCLESHLNGCAIIGEDLGVVPDEFRRAITEAGIFTNRVFYFEKEHHNAFKSPQNYDVHALAMVNNHDVPTLKSWWDGTDLLLRDRLNIFEEGVDYAAMVEQRTRDKHHLFDFLVAQNSLPQTWLDRNDQKLADTELVFALLSAVSRVASKLYVIQLEDVLLMDSPVNVPGTYQEHPNWQRKISKSIEDIFDSEKTIELLKRIDTERRKF